MFFGVEHDEETIRNADRIIDIGPKAGEFGGNLLFSGIRNDFFSKDLKNSLTKEYLIGKYSIAATKERRPGNGKHLTIIGASHHNLKDISAKFLLGALNVVTGVSGAGKSSLVHDILANRIKTELNRSTNLKIGKHTNITGTEHINKIIEIDQSPIGRTPRSNPATYTKLFDHIRDLYAGLPDAKEKKLKKGAFSFNNKGGRCESCQGAGLIQIGMHFMGNVDIICDACKGKRFTDEILTITYHKKTIFDVLEMSIDDACLFFSDHKKIMQYLSTLQALGLGYLTLGQPATTLSGGEAQRIKLASELSKQSKGHTLYILDEPTTGLHAYDIEILLASLNDLVNAGHTVIIIEHHTDIIKSADHILDLGPGSGVKGGELIASGTPEEIIKNGKSFIGKELKLISEGKHDQKVKDTVHDPNAPIEFKGITTHNLKSVDISVPVNKLTVITGISGSGKSSLAFDTIFSEGQKRYSESLSTYMRSMIKQTGEARFKEMKGMTPAVAVNQHAGSQNPRSTLGTVTEIYDHYRLLFSRVGENQGDCTMTASMFSFNHQSGACETCKGLGYKIVCDPIKLVSDPELPLTQGAMNGHKSGKFYGDPYGQFTATLVTVGKESSIDFSVAWKDLHPEAQQIAMFGTGEKEYDVIWKYKRKNREGQHRFITSWKGFTGLVEEEFERKHADKRGDEMMPIMKHKTCEHCKGSRLKPDRLKIRFAGLNIAELSRLSIKQSLDFFETVETKIADQNTIKIIDDLRIDLIQRLKVLNDIGLSYLSIDRRTDTLSGGEARRMRLAGQIVSGLTGITYVLDEPSIGLHSSDTEKLINLLYKLRDAGNSVIVVEHDADIISKADHIIDMGPGAGKHGGEIIAEGTLEEIISNKNSITGSYLKSQLKLPKPLRTLKEGIKIKKARANNLKHIDIELASGGLTALTGVSGSGKSSLLFDVLYPSYRQNKPVNCESASGFHRFDKLIKIDQSLPGKSITSNLATYLGFFDIIREIFASEEQSKQSGFKKGDFSFNTKGGRCESCKGQGTLRVSMDFLSDIRQSCEDCKGKRYQDKLLEVKYNKKDINQVLEMTVEEAKDFFESPKLKPYLEILSKTGLNYLTLGQSLYTFSGGEMQRIKLAGGLINKQNKNSLYLLDEPTTGLHFKDVENLLLLIDEMIERGHSVIVIEHNQDVIRHADKLIELGPEGGENGGYLLS